MPSRRGDRAAPPPGPEQWDVVLHTSDAAKGWDELCRTAPGNTWEAWVVLRERPIQPVNRERQHRLKGKRLSAREVKGQTLEQWQYEVTSGARIWYCPDPDAKVVWVTFAAAGHPWQTDR
jgi:hypothetical protein